MDETAARNYRLRIGEAVIELGLPSSDYAASMEDYFGERNVDADPQFRLVLKVLPTNGESEVPCSLFVDKRAEPDGFSIGDLIRGRQLPGENEMEILVRWLLTKGQKTRIFEQILYQAFYSARRVLDYDAFLIHSSGVIHDGGGFLFVGASGTGKSTVAGLSRDEIVLNDEMDLVSFEDDRAVLNSTPFNGYFREKAEGRAPLRAVFLLAHGERHRVCSIGRAEAVCTLAGQIVPPVALEEIPTQMARVGMLDAAERLWRSVPVRRLEFLPDAGFWNEIDREFPPEARSE